MFTIGPIGFVFPVLLAGLFALPILWLILRATPPAPIRRRFAAVTLLLGLEDRAAQADRTPWWLLLLRMLAIAAVIIGFAGPILNPVQRDTTSTGPLLIALDGTWADARDWPARVARVDGLLAEAARMDRPAAVITLTAEPAPVTFQPAELAAQSLPALSPAPWQAVDLTAWQAMLPQDGFETYWLSDGVDHAGRAALYDAFAAAGDVTIFESPRPLYALSPPRFADGAVQLSARRLIAGAPAEITVSARGPDPAGIDRELARATLNFPAGEAQAETALTLPPELRNRITRVEVAGERSAASVALADDSLKRRKVALIGGRDGREGLVLLSPTHYLRQALTPVADLMEGSLSDILAATPDVIILADVARLSPSETDEISKWLEGGGLLLRFAGPQLAASDVSRLTEDPLMPVRLREGGRTVGGAMSWGEPKALAPFADTSPFFGLNVPVEVQVTSQVLAQPDPDLAARTIAALADGTPLVTRKAVGQGQVVLFHVTANAEWSNLPLSGLFMQMLERLAVSARGTTDAVAEQLAGQTWVPEMELDAYGQAVDAGEVAGVQGEALADAIAAGPSAALPPGLYAGADRRVALNVAGAGLALAPAEWPATARITGIEAPPERALKGAFLAAALVALMVDILGALWVSGRLFGRLAKAALIMALALPFAPRDALAQDGDDFALQATRGLVLAHVVTGDSRVDDLARQGLLGLGDVLWARTSIEPEAPMGVDIERDELAFFPFLYWPVTANQPLPSAAAYAKLNDYMRTGGMILFDTRDGDLGGSGSPESQHLQRIAAGLDIPPLEPIPADHVLTRSFYLLQDFAGRQTRGALWVEAAPPDAEQVEGMPFRNLNDGVTPVVIGGNDWAAAWAVDESGGPLVPVGRGFAGERQREMAYRFGVNLIMHVLTGNYKSDQVHVPALLDRLGQ